MLQYHGRLFTKNNQTIARIPISHHYDLEINCNELKNEELSNYLEQNLLKFIKFYKQKGVRIEAPESLLGNRTQKPGLEIIIPIDYQLQKGMAERIFPILGHMSNVLAILSLGTVSFWAMKVTVGKDDEFKKLLSFIGALYSLLITFSIYVFSGASSGLAGIGRRFDGLFSCTTPSNVLEHQPISESNQVRLEFNQNNTSKAITAIKFFEGLGAGIAVLLNAGINGITTFQEIKALASVAVAQDEQVMQVIAKILPFILILAAGISNSAFQWGFIRQALQFIARSLCRLNEQNNHQPSLEEDDATEQTSLRI